LFVFLIAALLIMWSAEIFVKGAVEISLALRLKKIFVAATIVSLVTTLPEFIVSVYSSSIGQPGMAVGNAVGSCICNIGLVLAVGAMMREVKVERQDFVPRMLGLLASLLIVYFASFDGVISRTEALILLVFLAAYFGYNYRLARRRKEEIEDIEELADIKGKKADLFRGTGLFLTGGILTIIFARYGLVDTGLNAANLLNIPPILIGLTLTAIGTSLPELFTAIASSREKHGDIIVGNVIGANVLDLLWVLGFAALLRPLSIDRQTLVFNMPFAIFITAVMFFFGLKGLNFGKSKGIVLLGLYVLYIVALYMFLYGRA